MVIFIFFISADTLLDRRHLFVYVQYHVGRSWAYSTCTGSMLIAIKSSSQAPGDTATSAAPGVPSCTPSMSSLLNMKQPLTASTLRERFASVVVSFDE